MTDQSPTLLEEIESFLAESGMAESTFGRQAVSDWKFITQLRGGRRVWPETAEKARAFIKECRSKQAAAA